jgi:hypothetical protein
MRLGLLSKMRIIFGCNRISGLEILWHGDVICITFGLLTLG